MNSSKLLRRVMIGAGGLLLLLLLPVFALVAMSGMLLGVIVIAGILAAAGAAVLLNAAERVVRGRSAKSVTASTLRTRRMAEELHVPLVESIWPLEQPVEVIVKLTDGGCPLMRKPGDVFRIDRDGRLSSPLCGPSAATVQRLLRSDGLESGSTAHCVCPIGPYELTFALAAA